MRQQDVEAELSYAYLHAVASRAGIACQPTTRGHDNQGVDAILSIERDFGPKAALTEITINVQLKATTKQPTQTDAGLSYSLDVKEYNRLRRATQLPPRLLVVLFLPQRDQDWLIESVEQLVIRRCAYWLCLTGAPETTNTTERTIYVPPHQALTSASLLDVFRRVAHREELGHGQ